MTAEAKLDPRLQEVLREASTTAARRIPVLIDLADQPRPSSSTDLRADREALAGDIASAQSGLLGALGDLGISPADVTVFSIVNAISTSLTPSQIAAIAGHPDVSLVRFAGTTDVAL